ncbi:MAG: SDR family oxidoreductase [Bacteroidales bacterium]|nr:SDR family oxidoreductase [Bacteroidales bacterium]
MYNPFSLEEKTILVTGASSGIGRAAAIECSKMGAKVVITARDEKRLSQTLSELEGEGHQMVLCDLNNEEAIDKMVADLPELQGLINNAGFTKILPVQFLSSEEINSVFQVNTVAPMILLQKLLKKKKLKKGASVVFTSSLAGMGVCTVGNSMYSASKGAISAFIRCVALELAPKKIRVNAVCPGMVDTGILDSGTLTKEQLDEDMKNYPLGRYGKPEDIAWAMIYLLSDASSWVTGDNLIIDGGVTIK